MDGMPPTSVSTKVETLTSRAADEERPDPSGTLDAMHALNAKPGGRSSTYWAMAL
jgi:hypothetical protein